MEFKVYRNNEYIGAVDLHKTRHGKWSPTDEVIIQKGDILENTTDGTKHEVVDNNPETYLRAGITTRPVE